jgi:hypothetical protein
LLLESVTTSPAAGAPPLRVTVAVELLPPVRLAGLSATEVKPAASSESVAGFVTLRYVAEIVREVVVLTG